MQVQYIRFALRKKARESKLPDLGLVTVLRVHSVPGKCQSCSVQFLLLKDIKFIYWYAHTGLLMHSQYLTFACHGVSLLAIAVLLLLAHDSGTVYLLTSSLPHHSSETKNAFISAIIRRHCSVAASP